MPADAPSSVAPGASDGTGTAPALDRAQLRAQRHVAAMASAAFAVMGATIGLIGPMFPRVERTFGLSSAGAGLLVTVQSVGGLVGIVLASRAERAGSPPVRRIPMGLLVMALGLAVVGTGGAWALVLVGNAVYGFGYGIASIGCNSLLTSWTTPHAARLLTIVTGSFGLGAVSAPLLVDAVRGVRTPYLVCAIAALPLVVWCARLPFDEAIGHDDGPHAARPVEHVRLWAIAGFFGIIFAYVAAEVAAQSWMTTHLESTGRSRGAAGGWTAGFWIGLTVGRFVTAAVATRFRTERVISAAAVAMIACAALATLPSIAPMAWVLYGFCCGPVFPFTLLWLRQRHPIDSTRFAGVVLGGYAGASAATPAVGLARDTIGAGAIPLAVGAWAVLNLGIVTMTRRREHRRGDVAMLDTAA